ASDGEEETEKAERATHHLTDASTPSDRWQVSCRGAKDAPMRLFKFALPVLFVAGVALLAARAWTDRADAAARSLLLEHSRHQFSQRAAVARTAADLEHYRGDLRALFRGWFAEQVDIGNRFPLLRGQPAPFVPPPPKARGGDLREFQELAEKQVGAWREGRVELVETA